MTAETNQEQRTSAAWSCDTCGSESPSPEYEYCLVCGRPRDPSKGRPCAACETPLAAWQRFCIACGAPVAGVDSDSAPAGVIETRPSEEEDRRAVPCPSCGRPTGTVGGTCRWCGADLSQVVTAQRPQAPPFSRLIQGKRLWIGIGAAALAAALAVIPWMLFAWGDTHQVLLLNPPSGGSIDRQVSEPVHIYGLVLGTPEGSQISLLVEGEEVWSETYSEGGPPPIPQAIWTPDEPGTRTVTIRLTMDGGEEITDTAVVVVRDPAT